MMTKASFTNEQWRNLCSLAQIGPVDKKLYEQCPTASEHGLTRQIENKSDNAGGLTQQELDKMAVTEKTVRNPPKGKSNRRKVCCLQSINSAPGCKEVLTITSREDEHSNNIPLFDDNNQDDVTNKPTIPLHQPTRVQPLPVSTRTPHPPPTLEAPQKDAWHTSPYANPLNVSRTPAHRALVMGVVRDAAEPQFAEGGSALKDNPENTQQQGGTGQPESQADKDPADEDNPTRKEISDSLGLLLYVKETSIGTLQKLEPRSLTRQPIGEGQPLLTDIVEAKRLVREKQPQFETKMTNVAGTGLPQASRHRGVEASRQGVEASRHRGVGVEASIVVGQQFRLHFKHIVVGQLIRSYFNGTQASRRRSVEATSRYWQTAGTGQQLKRRPLPQRLQTPSRRRTGASSMTFNHDEMDINDSVSEASSDPLTSNTVNAGQQSQSDVPPTPKVAGTGLPHVFQQKIETNPMRIEMFDAVEPRALTYSTSLLALAIRDFKTDVTKITTYDHEVIELTTMSY